MYKQMLNYHLLKLFRHLLANDERFDLYHSHEMFQFGRNFVILKKKRKKKKNKKNEKKKNENKFCNNKNNIYHLRF